MKDLIERQAAIDEWKNDFKGYVNALNIPRDDYNGIMAYIDELPSAQPDIIACADCKHWICHDRRCGFWNHGVKPLDWCCYAERREE